MDFVSHSYCCDTEGVKLNNYGIEWTDENGKIQWKEAQYLADLMEIIGNLLGSGIKRIEVCRLTPKG